MESTKMIRKSFPRPCTLVNLISGIDASHCSSRHVGFFKVRYLAQPPRPSRDLLIGKPSQALATEVLDSKRSHNRTEDDRAAHRVFVVGSRSGEIPHKPSREAVTGSSWIEHILERVSRGGEVRVVGEHHSAVLTSLYDQSLWPHGEDPLSSANKVRLLGKLSRFGIIDDQDINFFQRLGELGPRLFNPIVHRIGGDYASRHLAAHFELKLRLNIGKEQVRFLASVVRKLRLEIGKDVQLCVQSLSDVQVVAVLALPVKAALPFYAFKIAYVYSSFFKHGFFGGPEIIAYYPNHANIGEE